MSDKEKSKKKKRPSLSAQEKENEMISLATDLAEKQLRDGTATSQVIVHYLKLGTMQHQKEMEELEEKVKHLQAKTESLNTAQHIEELYSEAISAVKKYQGIEEIDDEYD